MPVIFLFVSISLGKNLALLGIETGCMLKVVWGFELIWTLGLSNFFLLKKNQKLMFFGTWGFHFIIFVYQQYPMCFIDMRQSVLMKPTTVWFEPKMYLKLPFLFIITPQKMYLFVFTRFQKFFQDDILFLYFFLKEGKLTYIN